ncbi:MAG TPA: hypothetical protein VJ913_12485 [Actinomycetota bacterium]|nr:hypothetical protein [Actinomycetota bacterium]
MPGVNATPDGTGKALYGTWHAGTWHAGKPIVKVAWEADGRRLSSGFGFADRPSGDAFVAQIRTRRPG